MTNPLNFAPVVALLALGAGAVQAHLDKWGPTEPAFKLVMQYRTDSYVLDHGMTRQDCSEALPFGDPVKLVHFSCEQEG